MNFLYEYMSEGELQLAQEEAINENAMVHLNAELDRLVMEHEVRMNDIEMQILVENGTADDLQALYEREYNVMVEGVSEWWEKFKAKIKQIWHAIIGKVDTVKGAVTGDSKNDVIEVKGDVKGIKKFLSKVGSIIKNIGNFKTEDGKLNGKKVAATIGIAVGGGIGIAAIVKHLTGKTTKMTKAEAEQACTEMKSSANEVISTVDALQITDQNDASMISNVVNGVQQCVTTVTNSIAGLIGTSKGSENDPIADDNKPAKVGKANTASPDKVLNRNNAKYQRSGRVQDSVTGNKVAIYPPKNSKDKPHIAIKTPDGRAQTITKRQLPNFVKDRSVLNDMYAIYKDMESGNKTESVNLVEDFNTFNESAGWKASLSSTGAILFEESVDTEEIDYGVEPEEDTTATLESSYDELFDQYADLDAEEFLESTNENENAYDEILSLLDEI